ncbi:MAG: T9SS type A sorting domain-containing protein [Bacteroidetes bacterium]|nr:T9SS type A sorting domain-containing protein [Bacteroidota bacterium]
MKKQVLLAFLVLCSLASQAQDRINLNGRGQSVPGIKSSKKGKDSFATIIYSENFANGIPSDWVLTDSAGLGETFFYSPAGTGPSGQSVGLGDTLKSTTASNGFIMVDDDALGQGSGAMMTEIYLPGINCTANTIVILSFEELYRHFTAAADEGIVYVSNDSITWVEVHKNSESNLANNQSTDNPNLVSVDISAVAAQQTLYIRFLYRGDWGYWWQIDDIALNEPFAIDAKANIVGAEGSCTGSSPVLLEIFNAGALPISNCPVWFSVNGGAPVMETYFGTINPLQSDLYLFAATATGTLGANQLTAGVSIPNDGNAANDSAFTSFDVYSPNNLSNTFTNSFEVGIDDLAQFEIIDLDGDGDSWDYANNAQFSIPANTGDYCLRDGGNILDDDWLLTGCFDLSTGPLYVFDFFTHYFDVAGTSTIEVYTGTAKNPASLTQLIATVSNTNATFWNQSISTFSVPTTDTYYFGVRVNQSGSTPSPVRIDDITISYASGTNENALSAAILVAPNPATDVVNIILNNHGDDAFVRVYDELGRLILTSQMVRSHQVTLDVSGLLPGVYMLVAEGVNTPSKHKLVIAR